MRPDEIARVIRGIGTARHGWYPGSDEFEYVETEHPCPTCGQGLLLVTPSRMLVCSNKDTDPLFLI